jgi:DSF synthase
MDDVARSASALFNHVLIEEIMNISWLVRQAGFAVDFWVTGSLVPGMYNVGAI